MFAHIRKRQEWVLWVVIVVVVISFVVFFTPSVGSNAAGGSASNPVVATFDGEAITQQDYIAVYNEVSLQAFLSMGRWPEQIGYNIEQEIPNRLMMIQELNDLGIVVGPEAVAKYKANAFSDPETGAFQPELYDNVLLALKARRLSEDDLNGYIRHQIGIGQLTSLVSLSGQLVTPAAAERTYKQRNLSASTTALLFSRTNHMSAGQDLIGLEDYFTNNMALYRVEEKRRVRVVKFAATNYLAEAETRLNQSTNLSAMIDAIYIDRGTNSFTENGEILSAKAAKEQIKEEELEKSGLEIAVEKTKAFMRGFEQFEALSSAALEQLAAEQGVESTLTDGFTRNQLAPGLGAPYSLTQQTFELSEEAPIAPPIESQDALYLIALEEIIPDHPPTLDEVRPRVTSDFRRDKQLDAARAEADSVHEAIKAAMQEGKGFEEACSELGQTPVSIPNFSLATRTLDGLTDRRVTVSWLQDLAFAMDPGTLSDVSQTSEGAGILFLKSFEAADATKMAEELGDFTDQLKQTGRSQTISAWINEELSSFQLLTNESDTASEEAAN